MGRRHFKRELVGRIAGLEAYLRPDVDPDGFTGLGQLWLEEKQDGRYREVKLGSREELLALLDPADAPVVLPPKRVLTEKDLRRRIAKVDEAAKLEAQAAELTAQAAKLRAEALS